MNKQELIQDLKSKDFCDSINGEAKLQEVKQDGGKWYIQNVRELQSGSVATYRNVSFYVVNEDLVDEAAYYQDKIPVAITNKILSFTEKLNAYIKDYIKGVIHINECDEAQGYAVVTIYTENIEDSTNVFKKVLNFFYGDVIKEKRFLAKCISDELFFKEIA